MTPEVQELTSEISRAEKTLEARGHKNTPLAHSILEQCRKAANGNDSKRVASALQLLRTIAQ